MIIIKFVATITIYFINSKYLFSMLDNKHAYDCDKFPSICSRYRIGVSGGVLDDRRRKKLNIISKLLIPGHQFISFKNKIDDQQSNQSCNKKCFFL